MIFWFFVWKFWNSFFLFLSFYFPSFDIFYVCQGGQKKRVEEKIKFPEQKIRFALQPPNFGVGGIPEKQIQWG